MSYHVQMLHSSSVIHIRISLRPSLAESKPGWGRITTLIHPRVTYHPSLANPHLWVSSQLPCTFIHPFAIQIRTSSLSFGEAASLSVLQLLVHPRLSSTTFTVIVSSCFINLHSSRHRPCQDHPSSSPSLWSITTLIHPHHVIQLSLQRTRSWHLMFTYFHSSGRHPYFIHSYESPLIWSRKAGLRRIITWTSRSRSFIRIACTKGLLLPANFAESRSVGRSHVYELTWHVHSHPSCSHPIPMQWTPPLFAVLENLARMAINKHKNSLWLCVCMYSRTCLKQYCLIQ